MAKALYGHVGSESSRRLSDEVWRLRTRTRDLECEIARLQAENDRLEAALGTKSSVHDDELQHLAHAV